MVFDKITIFRRPKLDNPKILLGFSGWMDGGGVSTGIVRYFINKLGAEKLASIDSEEFYIHSFPGNMDFSSLFRPHVKVENGLIKDILMREDMFFCDEQNNLIFFLGREPNLKWGTFADCIFQLCAEFEAKTIYFIGSVAGLVPHTRDPRLFYTASDEKFKDTLRHYGMHPTDYEGPASFVSFMTSICKSRGIEMASLVATIPAYVQGDNPQCIEAVARRLANVLNIEINFDELAGLSSEFEKKLNDLVQTNTELAESIHKLEENYDNEIFNSEMGALKEWLQQQGIRVD